MTIKIKKDLFSPERENFVLFNEKSGVRKVRHNDEWYFSVVDIVGILAETKSSDKGSYRRKLKQRLKEEGSEVVTNCHGLKFFADDGKMRLTDAANTATTLRIIQSIPSPNAEPLKRRLASLGNERVEEINNPELGIERARARAIRIYKNKGMSDDWIKKRLQTIETRNLFTDELWTRGIEKSFEYALITNKTYKVFGDVTAEDIKQLKGLSKNDSIRDNMTPLEMQFTQMTESSAKEIIEGNDAEGFEEISKCVDQSVAIMSEARNQVEIASKKPVLTNKNNLSEIQKQKRENMKNKLK